MKLVAFKDVDSLARVAAKTIADDAREAIAARGHFALAVSGGHTPWIMLRAFADEDIPWAGVHVFQTDECVAPPGHPDRNLTHLRESLLEHAPPRPEQVHAMPVEADDLEAAVIRYALALREVAGLPPVLDLVHLGVKARIAIEQASTFGQERFVGTLGRMIGRKTFGASAPLKEPQRKFGFEPERVVAVAKELLGRK